MNRTQEEKDIVIAEVLSYLEQEKKDGFGAIKDFKASHDGVYIFSDMVCGIHGVTLRLAEKIADFYKMGYYVSFDEKAIRIYF